MVEVFKTNIEKPSQAKELIALLQEHFPAHKINVDMHDCDKVLRMEGNYFLPEAIVQLVQKNGFVCDALE